MSHPSQQADGCSDARSTGGLQRGSFTLIPNSKGCVTRQAGLSLGEYAHFYPNRTDLPKWQYLDVQGTSGMLGMRMRCKPYVTAACSSHQMATQLNTYGRLWGSRLYLCALRMFSVKGINQFQISQVMEPVV